MQADRSRAAFRDAQAEEIRERVEQAPTRRVSQRMLLALLAIVLGGGIVLLGPSSIWLRRATA